jgi:ATP-binding cassette, subfamily B, bacterial
LQSPPSSSPNLASDHRVRTPSAGAITGRRRQLAYLFGFITHRGQSVALVLGLTVTGGALGAVEPLLLKRVVDALSARAGTQAVIAALGVLALLHVVREAVGALGTWLTWRTRLHVQHALLDATVGRLHDLSVAYHRNQPVGMLLTKLDRGIQGFMSAFAEVTFNLVPAVIFFAISFFLMLRLDWRLCLLLTTLVPVPALIGAYAAGHQTKRDRALLDRWTRIYSRFNEVLSSIITVKSFAMERAEKQRFIDHAGEANDLVLRGVAFDTRVSAAQNLTVALARLAVLGLGAALALQGEITVGTLLAFLAYLAGLFGPVQGLTNVYQTLRRAAVALDAIFSILEAEELVRDHRDAREAGPLRGDLELEDVWFGYRQDQHVLRGINLHIPAGKTVALVGPSGGGKTSLAVLLQRLYEPQKGAIRIDGVDLRHITQHSLRKQIGVVMQDASLFNDTVRANIAYGRPDASEAQIEAAARAANAHGFIRALPQGYDTEIGERGGLLSAGQRQRLAIARALLKDPPLLILDEATSNLDAESEALVEEAVGRLLKGRTTLIIAHRLATVVRADVILVLRDGQIVEQGSHAELIAQNGHYAQLVALQTRGPLGGGDLGADLPAD